jgi:response regulator RpfG family c-di-GMP phosphodiesterase
VALADVFDALGSDRCYKKAWPLDKVLALIAEEKGQHFDPQLVELMMSNLDKFLEIREQHKDVYIGEH